MVCDRCIGAVATILEDHAIKPISIKLGRVDLKDALSAEELDKIKDSLEKVGLLLTKNDKSIIVVRLKALLVELYRLDSIPKNFKLSSYLVESLNYDYSHLSRVFSQSEKQTIESFHIQLRIEKSKELLSYKELSISEIAYRLGYSSNAHFSGQFKKIEGISPKSYRDKPIDRKSDGFL